MADPKEPNEFAKMRFPASLSGFGFDPELMSSVAESMRSISGFAVFDEASVHKAVERLQPLRPIVAPQISEALNKMPITRPSEALKATQLPAFTFAKTLEGLDLSGMTPASVFESLGTLATGTTIEEIGSFTFRDLPPLVTSELASAFDETARGAVVLAEDDEAFGALAEDAVAKLALTTAEKRVLALDVAALIAAFLLLAAWIMQDGSKDAKTGAGLFIACAVQYIRIYWRLVGKLDD